MKTLVRVDTAREQTFQLSMCRRSSVRKNNQSSSSAERYCCILRIPGTSAPTANQQTRSGTMLSSGVGGGRSKPRNRKLPQSDAGGIREANHSQRSSGERNQRANHSQRSSGQKKKATRVQGPRQEHTQQQGKIKRTEKAEPTAGKKRAEPTAGRSIVDLEEDWNGSKSDIVKGSIAKSKQETKAKAKAGAEARSTLKPFRVEDRIRGDWDVSNRVGSWRHMWSER